MAKDTFKEVIASKEELRSLLGVPSALVQNKVLTSLDGHCRQFISLSPMLFLATSDASGYLDVSPRGDAAGFVLVLDEKHLVIPERPGNKRFDSLCNIIDNPRVGLLFILPGLGETLRVNGKAAVLKDKPTLERLASHGRAPAVGIGVEVEECFLHCAKAFRRARLWDPACWPGEKELPRASVILAEHARKSELTEAQIAAALRDSYENRLY